MRWATEKVARFDIEQKSFSEAPSFNQARYYCSSFHLNGKIYAVAGCQNQIDLDTIERLDLTGGAKAWKTFSLTILIPRSNPIVCSLDNGEILIAGGSNRCDALILFPPDMNGL